jgi:hypothetical protein
MMRQKNTDGGNVFQFMKSEESMAGEEAEPEEMCSELAGTHFYNQKNKIPMKIPEFKRSGIGMQNSGMDFPTKPPLFCQYPQITPYCAYHTIHNENCYAMTFGGDYGYKDGAESIILSAGA